MSDIHGTGGVGGPDNLSDTTGGKGVVKESGGSKLKLYHLPESKGFFSKLFGSFQNRSLKKEIKTDLTLLINQTNLPDAQKTKALKKMRKLSTKQLVRLSNVLKVSSKDMHAEILSSFEASNHSKNLSLPSQISDSAVGTLIFNNKTQGAKEIKKLVAKEKPILEHASYDPVSYMQSFGRQLSNHINDQKEIKDFKPSQQQLESVKSAKPWM